MRQTLFTYKYFSTSSILMDSILQSKSNKYIFSSVKAMLLILYGVVNLAKGLPDLSNTNIVVGTKAEDPFKSNSAFGFPE